MEHDYPHHKGSHHGICGRCFRSPCCCHGFLLGAAMKGLKLGLGALKAAHAACCHDHGSCCCHIPEGTDIVVHALPGERRIVPYQIKNDTACGITVSLEPSPWTLCGCKDPVEMKPVHLSPAGPFEIPACGSASFDIMIETSQMKECQCYCTSVIMRGASCERIDIMVCVGGKIPAVCHHDVSKLRSWVRTRCFGPKGPLYVAPPAMVDSCEDTCK